MTRYDSGAKAERDFIAFAESTGRWIGVRSAGSRGKIDLVLLPTGQPSKGGMFADPLMRETRCVSVQSKRYSRYKEKVDDAFKSMFIDDGFVAKWWVSRKKGAPKDEWEIEVVE